MHSRAPQVVLALALTACAPLALGQKMHKCSDGKGGTTFQQSPCPETPQEAEAREKEKARLQAEAAKRQEEDERRKAEQLQKARERDKAYQEQMQQRAEEEKKAMEAAQRLMVGTTKEKGFDDGSLPPGFETSHPGAWRQLPHPDITAALEKNRTPGCAQYRYRQRAGGLPEFVVQCTVDKTNYVTWFVWPRAETVKGPAKF